MPSCLDFMSSLPSKTVQAPAARSGSLASSLPWPSTGHQGTADKRCNQRETLMPCRGLPLSAARLPGSGPAQRTTTWRKTCWWGSQRKALSLWSARVLGKPEGWLEAPGTVCLSSVELNWGRHLGKMEEKQATDGAIWEVQWREPQNEKSEAFL